MIIEYKLEGSITTHQGIFDTTGFWCVFEEDAERISDSVTIYNGWKIYGFGSFSFFSTERDIAEKVYCALRDVLDGKIRVDVDGVGFIRRIK